MKPKVEEKKIDFSLKQGEKIKVNINKEEKQQKQGSNFDFENDVFSNFPAGSNEQPKTVQSAIVTGSTVQTNNDPFAFFSSIQMGKKKIVKPSDNLLDL